MHLPQIRLGKMLIDREKMLVLTFINTHVQVGSSGPAELNLYFSLRTLGE
jgi:hypothetical protein